MRAIKGAFAKHATLESGVPGEMRAPKPAISPRAILEVAVGEHDFLVEHSVKLPTIRNEAGRPLIDALLHDALELGSHDRRL